VILPALPAEDPNDRYGVAALTRAWLDEQRSKHTRRAYENDLRVYLGWCQVEGLNPLTARPTDGGRYRSQMPDTTAPRTVARRMASVSSWYRYLIANGACDLNPLAAVRRPFIDREETVTVGLSTDEVKAILRACDRAAERAVSSSPHRYLLAMRDRTVLRFLAAMGMRRSEIVGLDLSALGANRGYRTIRYLGKGAKSRERALPAHLLHALDEYLVLRAAVAGDTVALFVTLSPTGVPGRLDADNITAGLRRFATQAGVLSANRITPHSFRHAFATNAREMGVALEDVQDAMGHADPRTTRAYDRARRQLHREPALRLGEMYEDN
jgi:site-specific recombinase XerD